MIYDVIIAGGGPAGSYLGYLLSAAGYKIAILEKEKFPRNKPCGGGVSPKALTLLPFDLSSVTQQTISKGILSYRNEKIVVRDQYNFFGIIVKRSEFDSFLMDHAINAGIDFYDNNQVVDFEPSNDLIKISAANKTFSCKFLIGADGVNSVVRSKIATNEKTYSVPSLLVKIPMKHHEIERYKNTILFDFGVMDKGYGWIFPLQKEVNVGIYSPYLQKNLKYYLNQLINQYPGLKKANLKYETARVPLKNDKKIYQKDNVLLIGDAACLCESFFGEGIYYSLTSAEIAFRYLQEYFEKPFNNNSYTKEIKKTFSAEIFYSKLLADIFYFNLEKSFYFFIRNDYISKQFAKTLAGKYTYKKLFLSVLSSIPWWLFSKRTQVGSGIK